MSGIAGIVRFDGAPVEPGAVERMTAAMAHRGPDGIRHWSGGSIALGQCMLCTTPESLAERLPLANEDASLVLVMDGRVDNASELRRDLLARGAVLRDRTDAELVLRAYEVWGDDCPDRIVGELIFVVWDARRRRLFGARDPAGTRHFYFHEGRGWFGFASEIRALVATGLVEPLLNETRLLDYLVSDFDRDDEVGTFYAGIERLPAGHAMDVSARGATTRRWWDPSGLPELPLKSVDEYAEAFVDQLRTAVKCRLRSTGRVGAMLSGGLDSSSIVGLIRNEFRGELAEPLRTYSLVRHDRENCSDWRAIREMLAGGWIEPTVITSDAARRACRSFFEGVGAFDEPFGPCQAFAEAMLFDAVERDGVRIVLDGIAGDLHFYSPDRSLDYLLARRQLGRLPAMLGAYRRHGLDVGPGKLAWMSLRACTPAPIRAAYRSLRERGDVARAMRADVAGDLRRALRPTAAADYFTRRLRDRKLAQDRLPRTERRTHAHSFMSGTLSFAHEVVGQLGRERGIEMRSPYSDRRLIEFSVRAPAECKLASPWYKHGLRHGMDGILPEGVRWRRTVGDNPLWTFRRELVAAARDDAAPIWNSGVLGDTLGRWIDVSGCASLREASRDAATDARLFSLAVLAQWMKCRFPEPPSRQLKRSDSLPTRSSR